MKEKKALASKLKSKLIKEQKMAQDNTRKLQKDNQKEEHQVHMKKLAEELKFYKEKVKVLEEK